ncbi:MAG: hypothetical protein ACJ8G2_19035 [Burkholderiales bacterium]|jgi:hypothetical protein
MRQLTQPFTSAGRFLATATVNDTTLYKGRWQILQNTTERSVNYSKEVAKVIRLVSDDASVASQARFCDGAASDLLYKRGTQETDSASGA